MTEQPSPYRFFFFQILMIEKQEDLKQTNKTTIRIRLMKIFFFCLSPTHPHDNRLSLYISIKTGLMCVMCVSVCAYIIPHYILNFSFWMFQWSSRVKYYTQRGVCVWEALQINFFFFVFFSCSHIGKFLFFSSLLYTMDHHFTSLSFSLFEYIYKKGNKLHYWFLYLYILARKRERRWISLQSASSYFVFFLSFQI